MALNMQRASQVATEVKVVADKIKEALAATESLLTTNSNLSIDWAAGSLPAYLSEDAGGNLDGFLFARGQVANALGSLEAFRKLMRNESLTGLQGDHLGNINQVAQVPAQ